MSKEYTIFIFRRDLRLVDNKGLIEISHLSNVIPIFIFADEQISPKKNPYYSANAVQFMVESLRELDADLRKHNSKLHFFRGDNITVLKKIHRTVPIGNIVFNMDYTPFAIKRDAKIRAFCEANEINCITVEDYLLLPVGTLNKDGGEGEPYTIFTPFKNNALKHKIDAVDTRKPGNLIRINGIGSDDNIISYHENPNILIRGGRDNGLKALKLIKNQAKYNKTRNTMAIATTQLSAYIKFGCISIREVYWKIRDKLGVGNDLVAQIFWREFYYYIAYYFPEVLRGQNYNHKYDKIKWRWNLAEFRRWSEGNTGYPVVDAGMRQLNHTGYMHNRARLITANFLNRMLGMDWRRGEKYFAGRLTDYDPAVNNGNWQWIASTGVDPKPYFQRLFNPWLQSAKFDPDAEYIKEWIPALRDIPAAELHQWDKYCEKYPTVDYPVPMVDYKSARAKSVAMYRRI